MPFLQHMHTFPGCFFHFCHKALYRHSVQGFFYIIAVLDTIGTGGWGQIKQAPPAPIFIFSSCPLSENLAYNPVFQVADIINVLHYIKSLFQVVAGAAPALSIRKPHKGEAFDGIRLQGKGFIAAGCFI